jgi:steroid 5-alpha reductase family enzyme
MSLLVHIFKTTNDSGDQRYWSIKKELEQFFTSLKQRYLVIAILAILYLVLVVNIIKISTIIYCMIMFSIHIIQYGDKVRNKI